MDQKSVIQEAEKFCKQNEINSYPVNIINLCENYDIKVFEEYLPNEVSGFVVIQNENFDRYNANKVIVVNLLDSARRRRFTIAHELAHYILHKKDNQLYAHRDAGQNGGIENEANIFASHILMPKNLVQNALSDLKYDIPLSKKIEYISDKFAVSASAAQVRLSQMKII